MARLSVSIVLDYLPVLEVLHIALLCTLMQTGHSSGRHIVDILKRNPKKDADKYTDEDLQHMRKVVSYCKVSSDGLPACLD